MSAPTIQRGCPSMIVEMHGWHTKKEEGPRPLLHSSGFLGCVLSTIHGACAVQYAVYLDRMSCSAVCGSCSLEMKGSQHSCRHVRGMLQDGNTLQIRLNTEGHTNTVRHGQLQRPAVGYLILCIAGKSSAPVGHTWLQQWFHDASVQSALRQDIR